MPEYILKRDGTVVRRPFEMKCEVEVELNVDNAILSQIKHNIVRSCSHLGKMDGHTLGVCQTDERNWFVRIRLPVLNLNCTVRAVDSFVIPSFEARGEFVNVPWHAPEDMQLLFGAHIYTDGAPDIFICTHAYLFAVDTKKTAYVLPLPNLYADAHLCTGVEYYSAKTLLDTFAQAFIGIRDSRWNNHLIHDTRGVYDASQLLFRFKSTPKGFETVASDEHWTKLSREVGTDVLNYICI